jgi:hypothetical protein
VHRPNHDLVLKILVVERLESKRADFVDAVCEMPGVLTRSTAGLMDALRILSTERVDALVVGALPDPDVRELTTLMRNLRVCAVIPVADAADVAARVESWIARRGRRHGCTPAAPDVHLGAP